MTFARGRTDSRRPHARGLRDDSKATRRGVATRDEPVMVSLLAAGGAVLALTLAAWNARAQSVPSGPAGSFRLVWARSEGASSCADGPQLARAVAARLGRNPFADDATQSIEGIVTREGDRWVARLYRRAAGGNDETARVLTSDSPGCASIDDAATLAIALAIDPERALAPPGPASPAPSIPRPPGVSSAAPAIAARTPMMRPAVEAQGALAFGLLPGAAPGAEVTTSWALAARLRAEIGVLVLPEERTGHDAEVFAFGLSAARLGACVAPWSGARVELGLCAAAAVGVLHAVVFSPVPTNPGERLWEAATAGPQLRVSPVGPLVFGLSTEIVVPFVRQRFEVQGQAAPAFQQAPVGAILSASVGLTIP